MSGAVHVCAGQTWERRNGTRFVISHVDLKYAHYWLAEGSKPQYRHIALENFAKRYRQVAVHSEPEGSR